MITVKLLAVQDEPFASGLPPVRIFDHDVQVLSPEILSEKFPLFSSSLFNLILHTEKKMGLKTKDHS